MLPIPPWLFGLLHLVGVFTFDAMMPLLNSICVSYHHQGYAINYGLSCGIGPLAYSVAVLVIGKAITDFGADWMIWIVLVLLVFFRRYQWYCVSLLGVMLLAMFHAMTENYLIEVAGALSGDSNSVGVALFIATLAEMPVLVYFDRIKNYIPINRLLKQTDMVKGQAFITASYTLGCAIGNFTGGQLLDTFNVTVLLLAGVVMAAVGTLILCLTVDRKGLNEGMY